MHMLTVRPTGQVEFAYVGAPPWHRLGPYLGDTPVDKVTIRRAAGMEWWVESRPVYVAHNGPHQFADHRPALDFRANVRSDNGEVLGIVSKDYKNIDVGQAFDFMDDLVGESAAMYYTAGSIRGGRQIFALVRLPRTVTVLRDDQIRRYMLMTTSFDGTTSFTVKPVDERVVCANTLAIAFAERAAAYSVKHVGNTGANIQEARRVLALAVKWQDYTAEAYRQMARTPIAFGRVALFLDTFLPFPEGKTDEDLHRRRQVAGDRDKVITLMSKGAGSNVLGVYGTVWGLYNAATEWIDHARMINKDGMPRKGGAEAAIFGVGQELRQRAWTAAEKVMAA